MCFVGLGQEKSMTRPHGPPSIFHHLQHQSTLKQYTSQIQKKKKKKLVFARSRSSEKKGKTNFAMTLCLLCSFQNVNKISYSLQSDTYAIK